MAAPVTLNVLLSFAQFEREVIGERIRDKFAASRRKGMWMGGWAPLGYEVQDRKLVINEVEGAKVRWIFDRFTKCRSTTLIVRELTAEGFANRYGQKLDKGRIYKLLNNRVYIGEAVHKGTAYPGEHEAIIARSLWDRVQGILAESPRARAGKTRAQSPALLKGLIYGPSRPMEVVVLKDWVTETKVTPFRSNTSTNLAKSMSERESRSILYGVPEADLAGVIGIDPKTLRKHYRDELKNGHVKANAKVAENLYRKATGEGREAVIAAIFWLKTRAGWKETTVQEHSGAGSPIVAIKHYIVEPRPPKQDKVLDLHADPPGRPVALADYRNRA